MGETNAIVKAIEAALASLHPVTSAIFTGVATYRGEKEMRFVKDVMKSTLLPNTELIL